MVVGQGSKYAIDLVICIDATGSMEHVIEEVKASALAFHEKLQAKMAVYSKQVHQLRIKVIVFRDYWEDAPDKVMVSSEFFKLPDEASAFGSFVDGIYADGGGDEPENALEALALAIRSPWDKILVKNAMSFSCVLMQAPILWRNFLNRVTTQLICLKLLMI